MVDEAQRDGQGSLQRLFRSDRRAAMSLAAGEAFGLITKRFTPEDADAMLPRLRRDLSRIRELIQTARRMNREKELCKAVGYREDGSLIMSADYQSAQATIESAVREADSLIEAIHQDGMLIKDLERGLVDFPAIIHGRDVLLCWELGEPHVAYFHDYTTGYSGRQEIPTDWRL